MRENRGDESELRNLVGTAQEYVEDCPVCCRANVIHVELDHAGEARVWAKAE